MSGLTWWQTLLIAVVPVLLTLIITNIADWQRRKQEALAADEDRKERARVSETARRQALEDYWRERRLELHSELVSISNVVLMFSAVQASLYDDLPQREDIVTRFVSDLKGGAASPMALASQLQSLLPKIRLTCGSEVRTSAARVAELIQKVVNVFNSKALTADDAKKVGADLRAALADFEAEARKEIGSD